MKFVTSLVCAAAAIACLPAAHADVLGKAKESGELTFAYRESSIPFSYLSGGQNAIGFSVDISNAIAAAVKAIAEAGVGIADLVARGPLEASLAAVLRYPL